MAPDRRVRDVLADGGDWIDVRGTKKHVAGYLKEFLFDPDLADARVGTLSGGERSRLLLAREFARPSNLLVLDEPTNDLDLETLDLLQEVISDYDGTVLIVSHDRDFLDRTVTVTLGLDGSGNVDIVAGGYEDWAARRAAAREQARRPAPAAARRVEAPAKARTKLSYKDQRDLDMLPGEIETLEGRHRPGRGGAGRSRPLCARPRPLPEPDRRHRCGARQAGCGGRALAGSCGNGGKPRLIPGRRPLIGGAAA